jgi:hypothetical protein
VTLFDNKTQVFIIRIWLEPREINGADPEWRGSIEQVPSGERHYLKQLEDIPVIVAPYLQRMGIKFDKSQRICWLRKWKLLKPSNR